MIHYCSQLTKNTSLPNQFMSSHEKKLYLSLHFVIVIRLCSHFATRFRLSSTEEVRVMPLSGLWVPCTGSIMISGRHHPGQQSVST